MNSPTHPKAGSLRGPIRWLQSGGVAGGVGCAWRSAGCLVVVLVCVVGCSPSKYRQKADQDAYCLIDSKSAAVGVEPATYRIDIDPRSRMFDPNNPDIEPMPPDDPTSNQLMQYIDCKKGSKKWKILPKTPFVENPGWLDSQCVDEDGQILLDLEGAVQMALLDSPRYQSELEELYLSALDVSFERFEFDSQFFGGSSVFLTAEGRDRSGLVDPVLDTNKSSTKFDVAPFIPDNNELRLEKMCATGSELVVGMANSLMWQFAGSDSYSSSTILDFSLVQPLLRSAGRTRVLERLTISERNLVANVREMERFRRAFCVSVATGRDPGNGANRRGGVFGGSGLTGFTGVGGGGFGRVGGGNFGGGNGGGGNITGGAGAQGAGGYLGLLQTEQVLRNQYANVTALRDSVLQLEASYEAGRIDRFQVDLARQAMFNAQSQLLSAQVGYRGSLESFLTGIGLPPELNVLVKDPILDQMNLLDADLDELQKDVARTLDLLRQRREIEQERDALAGALVVPNLPNARGAGLEFDMAQLLSKLPELDERVQSRIEATRADFVKMEAALPDRRESLERLATREELQEADIDPRIFNADHLDLQVEKRKAELENLLGRLDSIRERFRSVYTSEEVFGKEQLNELIRVATDLSSALLELSLAQAGARLESATLNPVDISMEQALAIAAAYRRDWMNARANLVDTWRLIFYNANDLRSGLNLTFSGDIRNLGDNPFNLRGSRGRLRAGLEFDAPLTRLSERNVYRQALIEYQQARRSYYQYRDNVYRDLRSTLRQIHLNELNFELRRAAVELAISQVDLTQLRLSEPPQPGETAEFNNTTARDLVQALGDLLNVQNDFLSVWVNHEVQMLNLELDLGVMEVDRCGLRINNPLPFSIYLHNLPCNTTDMGLAAIDMDWIAQGGAEPLKPVPPLEEFGLEMPEEEGEESVEPLPEPPAPNP